MVWIVFDVGELLSQGVRRQEIQVSRGGLGVEEDAPEEGGGIGAHVQEVESVPVVFHGPDKIWVGRELVGEFGLNGTSDALTPEIVGDEVEEVAEAEGEAQTFGDRVEVEEVAAVEVEVMVVARCGVRRLEVCHFDGRVECVAFLIGDARVGGKVADGELRRVEAGDAVEQGFGDAEVRDPGSH
jgi:hypothetical protein